jgi:hypothetical protein
MNWNQFSARRRVSLKDFISSCSSAEEALALFAKKQIGDPPLQEIQQLFTDTPASQENVVDPPAEEVLVVDTKKTKNASGQTGN